MLKQMISIAAVAGLHRARGRTQVRSLTRFSLSWPSVSSRKERIMKTRMILTLVAMVSVALIAGNASAALTAISLNFRNGSGSLLVTGTAGVVPQSNWNNTDGAQPGDTSANPADIVGSTIVDSTGSTVTGLDIAWAGGNMYSTDNSGNEDQILMDGFLDGGCPKTVTFTGLPAAYTSTGYDVYVYFGSDGDGRTGKVSDGTTTYSYATSSNDPPAFPGGYALTTDTGSGHPSANYAIFSDLNAANFTITATVVSGNNGMHGLQVVQIPEPATMALVLLALPFVMRRRRRR